MRVPLAAGPLYRSVVPLVSGEIGADLASYLLASEQTPAAVGVGVFVETDGRVAAAGGYLVQAMPGATDDALDAVAARVERAAAPSELVRDGLGPVDMLRRSSAGDAGACSRSADVRFRCRCSRERVGCGDPGDGPRRRSRRCSSRSGRPRSTCEFCAARYVVEESELRGLLSAASS